MVRGLEAKHGSMLSCGGAVKFYLEDMLASRFLHTINRILPHMICSVLPIFINKKARISAAKIYI